MPAASAIVRPGSAGEQLRRIGRRRIRAIGIVKTAPMLARTALGPNGSALPGPRTTLAAPNASADRRIAPTLPGSPTPCR